MNRHTTVKSRAESAPRAQWDEEGYPANLDAAALDALEWLLVFQKSGEVQAFLRRFSDCPERLDRCITTLERFLTAPNTDEEAGQ